MFFCTRCHKNCERRLRFNNGCHHILCDDCITFFMWTKKTHLFCSCPTTCPMCQHPITETAPCQNWLPPPPPTLDLKPAVKVAKTTSRGQQKKQAKKTVRFNDQQQQQPTRYEYKKGYYRYKNFT